MRTWKIIAVAGFTLIAAALLTTTAFAYMGEQGVYSQYGTNTGTAGLNGACPNGMMGGGHMGGMMGHGTYSESADTCPQSYGQCNSTAACQYQNNCENSTRGAGCHGYGVTP